MLTETENAKIAFTSVDVFNEFLEVGRQWVKQLIILKC
jgi:hypothetical protein